MFSSDKLLCAQLCSECTVIVCLIMLTCCAVLCVCHVVLMQEPGVAEQLSQNITRQGLTSTTLNFLRVSTLGCFSSFNDCVVFDIKLFTMHVLHLHWQLFSSSSLSHCLAAVNQLSKSSDFSTI